MKLWYWLAKYEVGILLEVHSRVNGNGTSVQYFRNISTIFELPAISCQYRPFWRRVRKFSKENKMISKCQYLYSRVWNFVVEKSHSEFFSFYRSKRRFTNIVQDFFCFWNSVVRWKSITSYNRASALKLFADMNLQPGWHEWLPFHLVHKCQNNPKDCKLGLSPISGEIIGRLFAILWWFVLKTLLEMTKTVPRLSRAFCQTRPSSHVLAPQILRRLYTRQIQTQKHTSVESCTTNPAQTAQI